MSEFEGQWFEWFTEGMKALPEDARAAFFGRCGTCCAQTGVINEYKSVFAAAGGDMDAFFEKLASMDGASGKVIIPGREYEIYFRECSCDLHTNGYINDPVLCECSKGSITYVMGQLAPDRKCRVDARETVLGGADRCAFRIAFTG